MVERPIMLRPAFVLTARAGTRTHFFMPGTFVPGGRTVIGDEAKQRQANSGMMKYASPWSKLEPGDRLWLQEDIAALIDVKTYGLKSRSFYKIDLPGGHVPIPGGAKGTAWRTELFPAKKMTRELSRYTFEVTAVRNCRAQEITWDEVKREQTSWDPYMTLGQWWGQQYGLIMPWAENPEVVGIDFTFTNANVDTGEAFVPDPPPPPRDRAPLDALFARFERERKA